MLFTVSGADFGSSFITMVPHEVTMVAVYVLLVSMVNFGGFLYVGFFFPAALGTVPPQATAGLAEVEGVGVGEAATLCFLPPLASRYSAVPIPPRTTATTRPVAIIRLRWTRRRSRRLR